ncbi:MAG TPA: SxtJ family membrane protein [Xanthomonadales bacterium]|nr:SxtJ family membrane protein [Xanthomonadales bacterium]
MSENQGTHEAYVSREPLKTASNRSFGLVMAAAFGLVAFIPLFGAAPPHAWALAISAVLLIIALTVPGILSPLNRLWTAFGLLLHRLVNPLVLGLLFFLVVTPTAWIMRALGKRPLALAPEPEASTYWVMRDPPGPAPESMKRQF